MTLVRKPMGNVFLGMLFFGIFLMGGSSEIPDILKAWPVYGVFIIPALMGIIMLLLTADEVTKIHGRFTNLEEKLDGIETKLDGIETKLEKLDNIEAILKEIASYLKLTKAVGHTFESPFFVTCHFISNLQ